MKIDLHLHTNCSDGVYSPAEVVRRAREAGLEIISLTDHDSCASYEYLGTMEGEPVRRPDRTGAMKGENNIRVIQGMELSSNYEGNEIHILGYFRDGINRELEEFLATAQTDRHKRISIGIENLKKLGVELSYEELLRLSQSESIGRNHLARLLIEHGYVNSASEAFQEYLKYDLDIVPRTETPVKTVIAIINASGGIAIWAHPPFRLFDKYLTTFIGLGLQGVEAYNRKKSGNNSFYYHTVAEKFGLMITAGSDWHGFPHDTFLNETHYPAEILEKFINHFN